MTMAGEQNENLDDLDLDHDDLGDGADGGESGNAPADAPKPGDQADGSYLVEVGNEGSTDGQGTGEGTGEGGDDEAAALEAKRAARREERAEQKRRRQEKDERTRRELQSERTARQALEQRLAVIERQAQGGELAQVDAAIGQAAQAYNYQKQRQIAALEAGNAAEAADAVEKMMNARDKHNQLTNVKSAYTQRQAAPKPLDPSLATHAADFMATHAWYKAEGADPDSAVTRALDNSLVNEGFDPRTPEYWDELKSRVKKYLPHRVAGGKVTTADTSAGSTKPRSVVSGSGRDSTAGVGAKATFKLSPDRVQAIKDAGMWDDTKAREKMIQNYRQFDKANGKA